jgi:serine/threonine protein kinase
MKCSSCARELPSGAVFCPACAAPVDPSSTPTVTHVPLSGAPRPASQPRAKSNPTSSSPSSASRSGSAGHFVAGTTLAARYRIVSLLGKGGMGEVFRAEDLRLNQTVALKFLPVAMAEDEAARERFHQEVRLAREISHANVCRVFDIGETEGRLFLTMEYVDGEDLASLLRRIGQFPQSKAVDIARQMCAGLAAAHDHGVLHRDLKPGNIMLDGRGRVRITDFGLAAIAENLSADEAGAGTPAYMAPEQLAGTEVTVRSDIYSLGLVLYEIFTGKKAFEAITLPELMRLRERSTPSSLSAIVKDIDPLVERVILRCLEKDPAKRPATALQVAAALPGGDPLAAALAAGETPSPEMVAAAGEKEGLRPAIAWLCLLLIVLGLAAMAFLSDKVELSNLVPLPSPSEVLAAKARDVAGELGYTAAPVDTSYSFGIIPDYITYVTKNDQSLTRWNTLSTGVPPIVLFWYRESPQFMSTDSFAAVPGVYPDDPPNSISGMCQIFLDTQGRLVKFEAVPPQLDTSSETPPAPNWGVLFAAAALDASRFKSVPPQWTPLATSDARAAWEGNWPGHPELPLRVEAASYRGKPVYFDLVSQWTKPDRMQEAQRTTGQMIQSTMLITLLFLIALLGIVLARSNVRSGRGDRRGAARLALVAFSLMWMASFLFAHHVPTISEFRVFWIATGWGLISAAIAWVLYIALEPHVRKRWPSSLISWSRLLAGQMRDPVVGRDLLVGILTGVFWAVASSVASMIPGWLGKAPLPLNFLLDYVIFTGLRITMADILLNVLLFVFFALIFFFIFFLIRLVLRKEWVAALVTILLVALPSVLGNHPVLDPIQQMFLWGIALLILTRIGLFAIVVALCLFNILQAYPLTAHWSAWYAEPTIFVFSFILAAAIFGFYTSTAGKQLFGGVSLDG